MRRINRERLGRRIATVAAVVGVVLVCVWAAVGFHGGVLFAVALGAAVAVAILSDTRSTCSPSFLRRRG